MVTSDELEKQVVELRKEIFLMKSLVSAIQEKLRAWRRVKSFKPVLPSP